METIQSIDLIATDADVRHGSPFIVGTNITVTDVVIAKLYHGQDADGISEWYSLQLSQVYAALSFYYDHKAMIDQRIRDQIRRSEELREQRVGSRHSLLP